jgi:glycosyltransferase involved in cell wall biosynthesis
MKSQKKIHNRDFFISIIFFISDIILIVPIFLLTCIARYYPKRIDVGLGPEPLINNVYHKKALEKAGYSAQTFVSEVYYITDDFDIRADLIFKYPFNVLRYYYLYIISIFRYRCLYIYFNGGPLFITCILAKFEPFLYRLANVKTVVMPYGGDIQEMSRCPNLLFKNSVCRDYPQHRYRRRKIASKIDLWIKHADHVIGGADWVDYIYYWDTLMLGHFSIDLDKWKPVTHTHERSNTDTLFRILHAPNHPNIKGTHYLIQAVEQLKEEGYPIELTILQKVPNYEIQKKMSEVDLIADQFVIGWYAMFAIEAMALEKPVLCFIREDLEEFYINAGLLKINELPLIHCTPGSIKKILCELIQNREKLNEIGKKSRKFVEKHHSLEYVGSVFSEINHSIDRGHD